MEQSDDLLASAALDELTTVIPADQRSTRRLNGFAKVARQRLQRNLAALPRGQHIVATSTVEVDTVTAPVARRAEAALLISAILQLRPDLDGTLSVTAGAHAIIEPDLLAQIDRIASQTAGTADEHARIALINAIIRDWLMAREHVAQAAVG